jgi:hypothetical protein
MLSIFHIEVAFLNQAITPMVSNCGASSNVDFNHEHPKQNQALANAHKPQWQVTLKDHLDLHWIILFCKIPKTS